MMLRKILRNLESVPILQYHVFSPTMSCFYFFKSKSGLMLTHQGCHEIQSWSFGAQFFLFPQNDTWLTEGTSARVRFFNLNTTDTLDWTVLCCEDCPMHYRAFSIVLSLYSLDASNSIWVLIWEKEHCYPSPTLPPFKWND